MNLIEFGDCREVMSRWISEGVKAQVALQHGRRCLGCELNKNYKDLQEQRLGLIAVGDLL